MAYISPLDAAILSVLRVKGITAYTAARVRMDYPEFRLTTTAEIRKRLIRLEKEGAVQRMPYNCHSQPYSHNIYWKLTKTP